MICPDCRGRGFTPRPGAIDDDGLMHGPCETCAGSGTVPGAGSGTVPGAGSGTVPGAGSGTVPGAGSGYIASNQEKKSYTCPSCGAESFNMNDIVERYCGRCHVFEEDAA